MSTQIEREFIFQAGVYFNGSFMMNVYELSLSMIVDTDSIREQNIAMDRIKYFLTDCLESSVFVNCSEKKVIEKYQAADLKVCALPEDPYDQVIAMILLLKLNAITEGRLVITDIILDSELSDGVKFIYSIETVTEINPFKAGWWSESTARVIEQEKINKKEKIVKLVKPTNDWSALNLDWKEKSSTTPEIIFNSDTEK